MKNMKRVISLMMVLCLCLSFVTVLSTRSYALTRSEFDGTLGSLRQEFPNYSRWTGSFDGGTQCFGFARLIAHRVFNTYASSWSKQYSLSGVKPGDLVQYGNTSGSGHTIFVTAVSGSSITFVDCNGNGNYSNGTKVQTCGIKWDNQIQIGAKMFGKYDFSYILSSPGVNGVSGSNSNPTTPPAAPAAPSEPIVHIDFPSGSYSLGNNIEMKGWIASNEPVSWVMADIYGYGQINLGMYDSPSEAAQFPQYQYFKRFNGVLEANRLTAGKTYEFYVFTSVAGGDYRGSFQTNGAASAPTPAPSGTWMFHLDTPTGIHNRYHHLELKGWLACHEKPAYVMAELVGKRQWVMNFYESTESMPGYPYFIRFSTVIDVNLLAPNQNYTILLWSSLGGVSSFTFQTGNIQPQYYSVSFHANGGTGAPAAQSKKQLSALTLSTAVPTRAGYTFVGWALSADGAVVYQPGDEFVKDANTVLYAVWENGCSGAHRYAYTISKEPDLQTSGKLVCRCEDCGAATNIMLPMLNREDYTYTEPDAPTCETQGTGRYTWNVMEYGIFCFDVVLPVTGHCYAPVVTPPTCTTAGFTTYTCSCGDAYTGDAVAALGHDNRTQIQYPTCTADGCITITCATCADKMTVDMDATGHRYESGICTVCGEADPNEVASVVKPTLTLKSPTLEFKDMICIVAFYTAENTEDVVEMGMITYNRKVDTVDIRTADYVIPGAGYEVSSGRYFSSSQGIHGKYLADTVHLACYAKLRDGSYVYTKLAPYSPITYATNQLKNAADTSLKQLCAAMLNYGAAAQTYFGHNTDHLANGSMTAEQIALPDRYRDDMVTVVPAASAAKQGIFANNQGFTGRRPAVSFEGAFSINYFFTPKYAPVEGITLYYWSESDFRQADVLTTGNATGTIELRGSGAGEYRGDIEGISAKNLSQTVYVAAVYSDGTNTWTSGVLGYSIGAYCSGQAAKGDSVANLAMATAVYGYHAKTYFG